MQRPDANHSTPYPTEEQVEAPGEPEDEGQRGCQEGWGEITQPGDSSASRALLISKLPV